MKENERRYIITPMISTRPNKIVTYNHISYYGKEDKQPLKKERKQVLTFDERGHISGTAFVKRAFHNFEISHQARKNLQDKVTWLYHLARARYTKTYSGKEIFNFKINFLTLTLPSKQIHPTSQITSDCFNQFLTEMRQRTGMANYVWRLEFQANGNVHYHIVSDTYIDYFFCLKVWNRIINKLGYVDAFAHKMNNLTELQYFENYGKGISANWDICKKRYFKGRNSKWVNPPSVDVKVCTSAKSIGLYISKYFIKKDKSGCVKNDLDNENNSFSLRLWFCSRSLSKLDAVSEFAEAVDFRPDLLIKAVAGVRIFVHQYATCFYFELSKMNDYVKSLLFPYLRNYANIMGYSSA
jgi:hypothetical protein